VPQLGIDIAWDRPTIAAIKATGAHWVARYFSTDATKNITAAEVHDYPAAGLAVVTVFESSAGRATQGRAAGIADARLAEQQRAAVGLPAGHVHHFAVDEDTSWASVQAYFDGAASVIGLARTGCYGGLHVIEGAHAHGIGYLWQTVAWSGGVWSQHATIRQTGGTTLSGGADLDYAEVPDFGQYPRPTTPEADMTPDEMLAARMPAYAAIPGRDGKPYIPTIGECINGARTADTQLTAVAAQITALTAAVAALQQQVAALSKAVGVPQGAQAQEV
jgi:hypothetical protein